LRSLASALPAPPPVAAEPVTDVRRRSVVTEAAPRATLDPDALTYHLLRPSAVGPADLPLVGEAYRCWAEVWEQTFAELESRSYVPSDDFTRQHEIGALFHHYECIALSFYRWVDLSNPIHRADSYFSVWSEEARDEACAHGSQICVSSNFTISAPWRRTDGYSLKDILGALVVERFLLSDADTLVGTMRADRGMSRLTDRLGFRRIQEGVIHHGVDVDLVAFHRDACARPLASQVEESIVRAIRPRPPHLAMPRAR
jgi:hypothetical protein